MKDSQKMIEIWRKWEAQINDIGTDLAVVSAMNEWQETKVKNLNLHYVMNCKIKRSKMNEQIRKAEQRLKGSIKYNNFTYEEGIIDTLFWIKTGHGPVI